MKSQTEKTKQISVANIAKEVLINIFQVVNNGIDIRFEEDTGEGTIILYIGRSHTHCGFPDATYEELMESLYSVLVEGKGLPPAHGREYQTGQKVAFKDTEDGVWVKGEITGIYHDNDLDYEILEIDDGMYYITHEGHAPIIII